MAKVIMIQGTMSNAGKSLIVAGLCRIFAQDGYRVAPFKSQNMALNSYVTADGLEMGRAQVMQAEAAGVEPDVAMNPILLKPVNHTGSEVIVNGERRCNMPAREYFEYKINLIDDIKSAFNKLAKVNDIIVIEGAGSPAEINLKDNDIVNMGLAKMVDAPVLLVGDIDLGGVFAQLLGTLDLLEDDERARVGGLIINKFRGDKSILDSGIDMIVEKGHVPVVGVVPYMDINLEDEDSQTTRFEKKEASLIDIAVIKLPRISNFSDFNVFEQFEDVSLRYVTEASKLGNPDMIILPGSKNTMGDLRWLEDKGFKTAILKLNKECETPIFGICGGYQMLGKNVSDPEGYEDGGEAAGLGLLSMNTLITADKTRKLTEGIVPAVGGIFAGISAMSYKGYEIHMGVSGILDSPESYEECAEPINDANLSVVESNGNVYGTYVHGFFDKGEIAYEIVRALADKKGVSISATNGKDYMTIKEQEFDRLASVLRENMDIDAVYKMLREAKIQ